MTPQHISPAAGAERGRSVNVPANQRRVERSRSRSPVRRGSASSVSSSSDDSERSQRWNDRGRRDRVVQPMRDVILLGLDSDVDADGLRRLVSALADGVGARLAAPPSDVTVIRDRVTGVSKGFGFAKFDQLDDAKRFVSMYAPYIECAERWLGPPRDDSGLRTRRKRIKIDYSDSERPQGGISYYEQHNAPGCRDQLKKARARRAGAQRSSVTDLPDMACENPGRRETAMYATPQLLLTGMLVEASAADIGAALCSLAGLHAVLLVRERDSRCSTGVAMAMFADADSARAALSAVRLLARTPGNLFSAPSGVRSSFADTIVLEEADPYDPTSAPWTYMDARGGVWRHEDERLGFDVWAPGPAQRSPSPLSSASELAATPSPPPYALPLPAAMPMPVVPPAYCAVPPPHAVLRTLDYADPEHLICVLCQRQFKSVDMLARHALESALHQRNLDDEGACRAGAARLRAQSLDGGVPKENAACAGTSASPGRLTALHSKRASMPNLKAHASPMKRASLQTHVCNTPAAPFAPDMHAPPHAFVPRSSMLWYI